MLSVDSPHYYLRNQYNHPGSLRINRLLSKDL